MSYASGHALQVAVFDALNTDAALMDLIGSAVFDAFPAGPLPDLYVSLGPETVQDRSDVTGGGSLHRFDVSVVAGTAGFARAKEVAAAVSDALQTPLSLAQGALVYLNFERAVARRSGPAGALRQIDLRFRARVDDNETP